MLIVELLPYLEVVEISLLFEYLN